MTKLFNYPSAVGEAAHFVGTAASTAVVWLTIIIELVGSALLILGRSTWLAAGALSVFTLLASYLAHAFWTDSDPAERFRNMNAFLEHIGLVSGLVLAAVLAQTKQEKE